MERFDREKQVFEDAGLVIFTTKSRMRITSMIATEVSERYPDHVVIIRKRAEDDASWKASIRLQNLEVRSRSGSVNVARLAKECSEGIGHGGGHEKASGALVSDWGEFKKRVLEYLGK